MASDEGFFSRWSRRKVQAASEPGATAEPLPPSGAPSSALATAPSVGGGDAPCPAHAAATAPADASTPGTEGAPPPPTLDEARALTPQDDFRRFVTPQVDPQVRNTALKRLFADPHFNVMDRLDVYIDDYGKPDPLPPGMLRQLAQSAALGLFADEPAQPAETRAGAAAPAPVAPPQQAAPTNDPPSALNDTAAPDCSAHDARGAQSAAAAVVTAEATTAPPDEESADEDPDLRLQPHDAAGRSGDRPHAGGDPGRQH
jgi:hypothetical protein